MKYKVHFEDNTHILDFELDSEYHIADDRLTVEIYYQAKKLGGNLSYCRYLKIEKMEDN